MGRQAHSVSRENTTMHSTQMQPLLEYGRLSEQYEESMKTHSVTLKKLIAAFCIRTFEQARKSYQPTKMFFETHKMMSHLLRCHRGDLISVGPILSLSPTQGVFLTRSSNPPRCQRHECGHLPLYPGTRSCMQISPPAAVE